MCAQYKEEKHIKHCLANALVELMRQYPFDDITINEICYTAHVARATYYHHANGKHGKEDLLVFKLNDDYNKYLEHHNKQMGDDILEYVYESKEFFTLLQRNKLSNVIISFLKYANRNDSLKAISSYLYAYANYSYLGVIYQWAKDGFQLMPSEITTLILDAHKEAFLLFIKSSTDKQQS